MRTPIHQQHDTDANGNPAGGATTGRGFRIDWQNGPLAVDGVRREPTGAFVEDVIAAALGASSITRTAVSSAARTRSPSRSWKRRCTGSTRARATASSAAWKARTPPSPLA